MNDIIPGQIQQLVDQAERELLSVPQVECSVIHRFGPGLYIREVSVPAGTFAIGHRQKTRHMNIMLKGRVTVINDNGTTTELKAPMMFVGEPGRKCGYVHEDMVWQNIYATEETDIGVLEATYLEKSLSFTELQQIEQKHGFLADHSNESDWEDYLCVLEEFGFTETIAREQSEAIYDQIPFPFGHYKCRVDDSTIEGKGLFATSYIEPGEVIAPARIDNKRTPAGRYTNHAKKPNAKMVKKPNGDIDLVATLPIRGCHGGMNGQEITIDYREALSLSVLPK